MKRRNAVLALLAIVAITVAGAQLLPSNQRTTRNVPASIDATGATDVTNKLNAFLRAVPANSTVVFPAKAHYKAEGTVLIDSKQGVVVEGNYALIFADTDGSGLRPNPTMWWQDRPGWPLNRMHVELYRSKDTVVKNLRIRGPNLPGGKDSYQPRVEGQSGISVDGCARCEVRGNYVTHVWGDGVEVNRGTSDLTVASNTVYRNGRQGMTVLNSARVRFEANTLQDIGRTYFDLEPERGGFLRSVDIVGNTVIAPAGGIFVGAEGAGGTDDVQVRGNHLQGVALVVRDHNSDNVSRRKGVTVTDNTTTFGYDNYPIGMIVFGHIDGVTVTGNHASARPSEAVRCGDCTAVTISGNSWQSG